MRLNWERRSLRSYRGISDQGIVVAQVSHVIGPGGRDEGWSVWVIGELGDLVERYPDREAAVAAAEAALDDEDDDGKEGGAEPGRED